MESVRGTLKSGNAGVYVHVPYCRYTCPFCPYFRTVLRSRGELEAYLDAVLRELELYGRALEDLNLRVVEVHVGGGTLSLAPPKFYERLREKLSELFALEAGIGIEVSPEDFAERGAAEEYYSCGVNEVSVGVQSFDGRVLKSIGRRHSPDDAARALINSLEAGFKWVNVDLMFLTPSIRGYAELSLSEKLEAFKGDLARAVELGAHQITYYATVVAEHSAGYKLVELGRVSQELDAIDKFVAAAVGFAEERGLQLTRVYSMSRRAYEYATVNLEMVGPLLGVGAGAWGNTGLYQYVNVHDVGAYVSLVKEGRWPAVYGRTMSEGARAWRALFDQLTSCRVDYGALEALGVRPSLGMRALLKLMSAAGLAERTGSGYRLTRKGVVEVYKAVINFVAEVPVKATAALARYRGLEELPREINVP